MPWQENWAGDPTRLSGNYWLGNKKYFIDFILGGNLKREKNPWINYVHVLQLLERLCQHLHVMWIIKCIRITNFQYPHRRYLCSTTPVMRTKLFQKGHVTEKNRSVASVINRELQKLQLAYLKHLALTSPLFQKLNLQQNLTMWPFHAT